MIDKLINNLEKIIAGSLIVFPLVTGCSIQIEKTHQIIRKPVPILTISASDYCKVNGTRLSDYEIYPVKRIGWALYVDRSVPTDRIEKVEAVVDVKFIGHDFYGTILVPKSNKTKSK